MANENAFNRTQSSTLERAKRESMPDIMVPSSEKVLSAPLQPFSEIDPSYYAITYKETCYPRYPFPDTKIIIDHFVSWFSELSNIHTVLELGCGPVLSHIVATVPIANEIIMSDFLSENLDMIDRWCRQGQESGIDWSGHVEYVLMSEGMDFSEISIKQREDLFRSKLRRLIPGDLKRTAPLGMQCCFPLVLCCYATEQAAKDLDEWRVVMKNLCSCVQPGGHLALSVVKNSDYYVIGDGTDHPIRIPIVKVNEDDLFDVLIENGFDRDSIKLVSESCGGLADQGLSELIVGFARRNS
jgi:SAM-dependent methyltransferase